MITDRYMPLAKAAKLCGVTTRTMRKWLEEVCGLVYHVGPYERVLVNERDLQKIIDRRSGAKKWGGKSAVERAS